MIKTVEAQFSSAHFYHQKKWSHDKNLEEFGLCYTPYGHGHNYRLLISYTQNNQNEEIVRQEMKSLLLKLDHQHLNLTLKYFEDVVPTTENIALYIWNQLNNSLSPDLVLLKLFETQDLWVEITND